jgi:hypothetical protein
MLTFVFLPAILVICHCSALVSLTIIDLLLGAPVLPTWRWVKISTYLHLELVLLITFMLLIVDIIYYYYAILSCYKSDLYYYYYYYYVIITDLIELLLLYL